MKIRVVAPKAAKAFEVPQPQRTQSRGPRRRQLRRSGRPRKRKVNGTLNGCPKRARTPHGGVELEVGRSHGSAGHF